MPEQSSPKVGNSFPGRLRSVGEEAACKHHHHCPVLEVELEVVGSLDVLGDVNRVSPSDCCHHQDQPRNYLVKGLHRVVLERRLKLVAFIYHFIEEMAIYSQNYTQKGPPHSAELAGAGRYAAEEDVHEEGEDGSCRVDCVDDPQREEELDLCEDDSIGGEEEVANDHVFVGGGRYLGGGGGGCGEGVEEEESAGPGEVGGESVDVVVVDVEEPEDPYHAGDKPARAGCRIWAKGGDDWAKEAVHAGVVVISM